MKLQYPTQRLWKRAVYSCEWDDGIPFGESFTTKRETVKYAKRYAEATGHKYGRDIHVVRTVRVSKD